MNGWFVLMLLVAWLFSGLAFWLLLVGRGAALFPAHSPRIIRSSRDRRRHTRPGSVDRRRKIIEAV